jgi:drug/metabolite transporter (DMT)-like permease
LTKTTPFNFVDFTLFGAVLIWALNFTVIKASLEEIGPNTFNALRFLLAAMLVWLLIWKRGDWFKIPARQILPLFLLGLFGNLLYQWLFIIGINFTFAANAAIMLGTIPIWVAVVSHLFAYEKMTRLKAIGVVLGFTGVFVIITGGDNPVSFGSDSFLGDMLIITAAFVFGIYTIYSKSYLGSYSPLQFSGMMIAIGAVSLTAIAIPEMHSTNWADISLAAYGGVVYSGALSIGLAYLIWNNGLARVGTIRTSAYQNLVPVLGLAFGVLLLNEQLNLLQYSGSAIAVTGIVLTRRG